MSGLGSHNFKNPIYHTLIRAFASQQALDRELEVLSLRARCLVMSLHLNKHTVQPKSSDEHPISLHQQVTSSFSKLNTVTKVFQTKTKDIPDGEPNQLSELERGCEVIVALSYQQHIEVVALLYNHNELMLPLSSEAVHNGQENFQISIGRYF